MLAKLRQRLGMPGVVLAVAALVFAMIGGAYAASNDLTGLQKKEVKKIAKQYAGKNGSTGPQGSAGTNGKDGAKGATGAIGNTGAAGPTGATGAAGPEGSPWTAGGALPSGKTETGTYYVAGPESSIVKTAISFPIPLPAEIDSLHQKVNDNAKGTGDLTSGSALVINVVKTSTGNFTKGAEISGVGIPTGTTIVKVEGSTLELSQTATASSTGVELTELPFPECENPSHPEVASAANPEADPGYLCVFAGSGSGRPTAAFKPVGGAGASTSGAILANVSPETGENFGTFAVTAPSP
jgi:hypothetical protein